MQAARWMVGLALGLVAGIAAGEDIGLVAKGVERGKDYRFSVAADGTVTISPLQEVLVTGQPPTNPPPNPDPVSAARVQAVRALTDQAITRGGTPATAAKLAVLYALVSGDCSAVPPKVGMPGLAPALITAATDSILKDAPDKAAWAEWRTGISGIVGKVPGIATDASATAVALDNVAEGVQLSINNRAVSEPGILDGINWEAIKQLLRPILEKLLAKLIDDLLKRLP